MTRQRAGDDIMSEERLAKQSARGLAGKKPIAKVAERKHMAIGTRILWARIREAFAQNSLEIRAP